MTANGRWCEAKQLEPYEPMHIPHPGSLNTFFINQSGLQTSSLKTKLAAVSAFHEGKSSFAHSVVTWLIRRMVG